MSFNVKFKYQLTIHEPDSIHYLSEDFDSYDAAKFRANEFKDKVDVTEVKISIIPVDNSK
jgi:hypothetical protein